MKWMVESERMMACISQHDWWERHPRLLREDVRARAEELAASHGNKVYQQHVLRGGRRHG